MGLARYPLSSTTSACRLPIEERSITNVIQRPAKVRFLLPEFALGRPVRPT